MSSQDARPTIDSLLAHRAWVRGIARALAADESRADDVEQETWLVAMDRPPSSGGGVRAWLRRVVRSRAVDAHRSESRRVAREQATARPEGLPATSDLVAKAEIQRDVAAAVCALDEPYRTTIILRHFEELEPREIAARLSVPVETVRTRLKRGHERLRELLDEEYGERRAWMLLVLPLARLGHPSPVATTAGGAAAMAGTTKLVAAAASVLVLAAGAWWVTETASAPEAGSAAAPAVAASAAPTLPRAKTEKPPEDASPVVEAGATVAVDVVDTSGRAIAAARVELARPPAAPPPADNFDEWLLALAPAAGGPARTAQTSGAGRADLTGVAAGTWRLRVSAANHADHEETVVVEATPLSRRVVLRDACTLVGIVSGFSGWSPPPGTVVLVAGQRAECDAVGRYKFDRLPAGTHDVRVGTRGTVQELTSVVLPNVTRLNLQLWPSCTLAGRVVDDATDAPVAGAVLRLYGMSVEDLPASHDFVAAAVSGEDGSFKMADLPSGPPSALRATHPEYAANQRGLDTLAIQMRLAPGYPVTVEVRMKRGGVAAGRVTTEDGAPVAGAKVDVLTRAPASAIDSSEPATTDAEGRFRVRAVCGAGMVRVRAKGLRQRDFPDDPWTAIRNSAIPPRCAVTVDAATEAAVDVVLVREPVAAPRGAIAGTVRREDGASAASTLVEVVAADARDAEAIVGTVGSDGAFRVDALVPGRYRLLASADGCAPARLNTLVVPDTGPLDGVEVVLSRERTISGRVLDAAGRTVSFAQIGVVGPQQDAAAAATAAADGTFVVRRLAAGTCSLTVRAPGYAAAHVGSVEAGTSGVEVRLETGQAISGIVVDAASGEPIAGMPVQASYATHRQGAVLYREVATDVAGRFTVPNLTSDTFTLWVGRANDASAAAEYVGTAVPDVRAGTTDVRVAMARGLAIEGRVVDAAGDPCSGGFIQAMGPKANPLTPMLAVRGTRIGRDGTFRLSGLASGTYDLNATPRSADGSDAAPVRAGDVQAGARDVVLRTEAGQVIAGRLLCEDGKPLPPGPGSVQVRWKNELGGVSWQDLSMIWSADGSFRTPALLPGRLYDIVVTQVPGKLGATVRGVSPGTTDLVVTVRDGGRISGRVVDTSGAPVPAGVPVGAHAKTSGSWPAEPGQAVFVQTAADGSFTLTGLADTEYRLHAGGDPSDFVESAFSAPSSPGATGVEIRVERGVTIAGRLVDAKGVALKGGVVEVRQDVMLVPVALDGQGRFTLRGLKPGTYRLSTKVGQKAVDLGEVQAPADALVLTVREE